MTRTVLTVTALSICFLSAYNADARKRPDLLTQEWDILIDQQITANNPLYEDQSPLRHNPLYEPSAILFNSAEFWTGVPHASRSNSTPNCPTA